VNDEITAALNECDAWIGAHAGPAEAAQTTNAPSPPPYQAGGTLIDLGAHEDGGPAQPPAAPAPAAVASGAAPAPGGPRSPLGDFDPFGHVDEGERPAWPAASPSAGAGQRDVLSPDDFDQFLATKGSERS
jgi:hypothetical protein